MLRNAFFGLARVSSRGAYLGEAGLSRGAPHAWVEAGDKLDEKWRRGNVVNLEFVGLLPPSDGVHVKRGGVQGSSYAVAAVRADWWLQAVASLGCCPTAAPATDAGGGYMFVPYLVMHPGYAYGKLQLLARCDG